MDCIRKFRLRKIFTKSKIFFCLMAVYSSSGHHITSYLSWHDFWTSATSTNNFGTKMFLFTSNFSHNWKFSILYINKIKYSDLGNIVSKWWSHSRFGSDFFGDIFLFDSCVVIIFYFSVWGQCRRELLFVNGCAMYVNFVFSEKQ